MKMYQFPSAALLGPVPDEGVPPSIRVQSKLSSCAFVQKQKFCSKLQSWTAPGGDGVGAGVGGTGVGAGVGARVPTMRLH